MTDIVKRLLDPDDMDEYHDARREAAAEIARLTAMQQGYRDQSAHYMIENANLRAEIEGLRACRTELDFAVEYYTHGLRPLDLRDWYTRACAALKDTKP